jgi:integrase
MNTWIIFLERFVYAHALEPNDYIFPSVTSTGTVQPGAPISHDTIQKWLDEFVEGANIELGTTRLTTHCFRRGGAQYRFMHAPLNKHWKLPVIRWWGGWAQGEQVIVHYFSNYSD